MIHVMTDVIEIERKESEMRERCTKKMNIYGNDGKYIIGNKSTDCLSIKTMTRSVFSFFPHCINIKEK